MAKEIMMVPTKEYDKLVGQFKGKITESALLNKAGRVAAERQLILQDASIPDSMALTMTKPRAKQLRKLTRRIHTGSSAPSSNVQQMDDDQDAMLNSPIENTLKKILKMVEKNANSPPKRKLPPTPTVPSKIPVPAIKRPKRPASAPPGGPAPPTPPKKKGGFKQALKKGALKGAASYLTGGKHQGSPTFDSSGDDEPKTKTESGWTDWYEGKKKQRHHIQEEWEETDRPRRSKRKSKGKKPTSRQ